jgi:hypothetical protein
MGTRSQTSWAQCFFISTPEVAFLAYAGEALIARLITPRAAYVHGNPAHSARAAQSTKLFKAFTGVFTVRVPAWRAVQQAYAEIAQAETGDPRLPLITSKADMKMMAIKDPSLQRMADILYKHGALFELVGIEAPNTVVPVWT